MQVLIYDYIMKRLFIWKSIKMSDCSVYNCYFKQNSCLFNQYQTIHLTLQITQFSTLYLQGCAGVVIGMKNWRTKFESQPISLHSLTYKYTRKGMNPSLLHQIVGLVSGKIILLSRKLLMQYSIKNCIILTIKNMFRFKMTQKGLLNRKNKKYIIMRFLLYHYNITRRCSENI